MNVSVRYVSSSHSPSGYGEASRNFITALFVAGVNVTTETISQTIESTGYGLNEGILNSLEGRKIPYKVKVIHLTPDLIPMYKESGVYTISHLFWETSQLPKEWIKPLNEIDEIWTASSQMVDMIRKSGVTTPCYCFPQPIWTDRADEEIAPFTLSVPKDFTFYSIFQWIERKNPRTLLRAYWKAFEGNNDVTLLLKTYRVNYSESEFNILKKDIYQWKNELKLRHFPKIYLVKRLLTDREIAKLHQLGDCYVNPSSGEGWCRPIECAMLYGKPVITASNGGITDLVPPALYKEVPTKLTPVKAVSHIPWYRSPQMWKEINETALSEAMLEIYRHQASAKQMGDKAREYVRGNFSLQNIGKQMKKRLEEIYVSMQ